MKTIFQIIVLLLICLNSYAETDCSAVTEISQVECESLLQLYHSTSGIDWHNNDGWNVTNTPCSWYGIICENNSVVKIRLAFYSVGDPVIFQNGNNLTGTIPDFKSLPNLRELDFQKNLLVGSIPNFSSLLNLQKLDIGGNKLTGEIPNFNNLSNLNELLLGGNHLTGKIPNFSNLPNLQRLFLGANQLVGKISDFSNLPNLETLFLSNNQLTGTIPNFSNLLNLETLYLENNMLTGKIPSFSNLSKLKYIYISNNQLTGTIPNFSNLLNLEILHLENNKLTGPIPNFSSLSRLEDIYIYNNQLTGKIPNFNIVTLKILELNDNQLTGEIPDLTNLPNLKKLILSNNKLTGPVPNVNNLLNLNTIIISGNKLTGTTDCNTVTEITQAECNYLLQFYYSIDGDNWYKNYGWSMTNMPCSWEGITCKNNSVVDISLDGNYLMGQIPDFSGLPNLEKLSLEHNQLTGKIPSFNNLSKLQYLNLSYNSLEGKIPDFNHLPSKYRFNFNNNQLATVLIFTQKSSYHHGESVKVKLAETFGGNYDLYAAILFPNSVDFLTLKNTNQFALPSHSQKWDASRKEEFITLINLPLPTDIPTGEYCIYGILSPKDEPVMEVKEQWIMDDKCFEVLPSL